MFRYADDAELQGKEHPERNSGRTGPDWPMSTLACVLLGAAIAGLYHLLPRMRPGRPFRAPLLALAGFLLAQAGLSAAITGLGLVPRGPFHDLLQQLTDYDGERPVVLLIGSSFSEAGIDPDVLAEALGSSGRAAAVQRLAVGGAPHLERLHYLKEYLARAKRRPQLVLFEIAGGYDSGPLYQVHQMRFSDRMVAMMDGSSAWWALRWLADADGLSLFQRLTMGSEILGQLGPSPSREDFLASRHIARQRYEPNPWMCSQRRTDAFTSPTDDVHDSRRQVIFGFGLIEVELRQFLDLENLTERNEQIVLSKLAVL